MSLTSAHLKKVTIIGAGFSGLTSAFYLQRAGFDVEIFESSERAGGLIATLETDHGLVETAANGLLNSTFVEDLFKTIGLSIVGTRKAAKRRYIFRGGRARRWPLGFLSSLRVFVFVVRMMLTRQSVAPKPRETIENWGQRNLGDEATKFLLATALQGIYAGDPSRLSASLILRRFFSRRESPSFGRRRPEIGGTVAPPRGMGQLMSALETYLRQAGVKFDYGANYKLGRQKPPHPVLIATNPGAAAELIDDFRPETAARLRKIEMNPVVTTTAKFSTTDPLSKGFGVLFPVVENRAALGVLKNSFIFEGRPEFSETWIQGGALAKTDPTSQSDDIILAAVMSDRRDCFRLDEKPTGSTITRWPNGIPHYTVELENMIPDLDKANDNVFLMGNYLGDLGLAKILERASKWPQRLKQEGDWS